MKKLFALLSLLVCVTMTLEAQNHLIEVKRYNDWGRDYLTVVDWNYVYDSKENVLWTTTFKTDSLPPNTGCLVTQINGESTKNMSESDFYQILDNSEKVKLTTLERNGRISEHTLTPRDTLPTILRKCNITTERRNNSFGSLTGGEKRLKEIETQCVRANCSFTELVDNDFDWFYAKTYDFYIIGNDPLTDKAILEKLAEQLYDMTRDTENPDVLLTVAKSADESVQSTYIPPTSRTINLGSTTRTRYNYLTKRNDYITPLVSK